MIFNVTIKTNMAVLHVHVHGRWLWAFLFQPIESRQSERTDRGTRLRISPFPQFPLGSPLFPSLAQASWGTASSLRACSHEPGFRDLALKEQYPVTAHAPNFDFWTGCREIKRCEESKRTLKNPFASRLAGFNTTIKLLRITDQWYIVPVEFRFGQNRDFLELLLLPLAGEPKDGKRFYADWRLISSASFHTSSNNCERNTRKRNSNNRDCKNETIETCDGVNHVGLSFVKKNVLQRRVVLCHNDIDDKFSYCFQHELIKMVLKMSSVQIYLSNLMGGWL